MNRNLYQTAQYVTEARLAEARYFRRAAEARITRGSGRERAEDGAREGGGAGTAS